jgi:dipeptidyl aminopeptidase/acylaminoacyl peptidase
LVSTATPQIAQKSRSRRVWAKTGRFRVSFLAVRRTASGCENCLEADRFDLKRAICELIRTSLDGRPLAASERFMVKSSDGFDIESFLTKPETSADQKLPLLVLPHGGPIGIADYKRFDREVQYFAKIGYAVLQVNFRGSGAGKSNTERGAGVWGTTMISDINAAVDAALKKFPIDENKIVAMGTSYGGYGAVRLLQLNPKRYKAAVGICGVYDLPLIFNAGQSSRGKKSIDWYKKFVGNPSTELDKLMAQSPVYSTEKLSSPILLVHDRGDEIAPFEHALRLQAALAENGNKVKLLTVNDEQHGLVVAASAIANYPKIAKFLSDALAAKTSD